MNKIIKNISAHEFESNMAIVDKTTSLIQNLKSISGVAEKTIAAIISECGDLTRFNRTAKFIGYLELFPTKNSSGNSNVISHLSKRGSAVTKHAIYMSSISCMLYNKEFK